MVGKPSNEATDLSLIWAMAVSIQPTLLVILPLGMVDKSAYETLVLHIYAPCLRVMNSTTTGSRAKGTGTSAGTICSLVHPQFYLYEYNKINELGTVW